MTMINEKHLLRQVANGNQQAFRQIFDSYRNKLFSYVLRITNSEEIAEEIVMDAFLQIWTRREELENIDHFDSYLYTVVRHKSFNAIKRLAREALLVSELALLSEESTDCTEDSVIYNEYKAILAHAVSRLPPQQKRIYNLKDEGMKYDEIALALNLSKNTVKAHLKKAVSSLRTAFSYYFSFAICTAFSFLFF